MPDPTPLPAAKWHAETPGAALALLSSRDGGLPASEAKARLARFGRNELPVAPRRSLAARIAAQFNNVLVGFLIVSAVVAFALDHRLDAGVILAVVLINTVIGFVQEGRAERALEAIGDMILPHATAFRDGRRVTVAAADLVPGDVVLIEPGDQVPADLRLTKARSLRIDESLLTGESVPVEKAVDPVPADAGLGDRASMAHSGTMVVAGQGHGLVIATGRDTEIGRISTLVGSVQDLTTPLLRQINRFGRRMTALTVVLSVAVFLIFTRMHAHPWDEALLVVVALAVGLVPEELPAVITIALAIGVQRMAARRAIVRRLPAVETLGSTTIICTDKTGTLTLNRMSVSRVVAAGQGIDPDTAKDWPAATGPLLTCALVCNDAQLRADGEGWHAEGDPTETALVALGRRAGIDAEAERAAWPRRDTIPFDAAQRFMAVLAADDAARATIFVKGAPERLLEMCADQAVETGTGPLDPDHWRDQITQAAQRGERVIGFAMKRAPGQRGFGRGDMRAGFTFLGIAALIDPPRPEARAAIAECRAAGIGVKMITGDHRDTAAAIALQLGLADDPAVLTGVELDAVSDADLGTVAARTDVFARTTSEQKLRIVRALQAGGARVAMTGDGVNDAPALKQADVGVAMGLKGTEAAKQASEMVLADDNFATIVAAVREGRTVYDNIRKVVSWTLPTNVGEALIIVLAAALGLTIPMTAGQILWVNMIPTVTLGLVLAIDPTDPGVMTRRPRPPGAPLLSPFLIWRISFISALFLGGTFGVFFWALEQGHGVDAARTMVVNTLVLMEIFCLLNVRHMRRGLFDRRASWATPAVLAAIAAVLIGQAVFTYVPLMNTAFRTTALAGIDLAVILGVGVLFFVLCELELLVLRAAGLLRLD